MCGSSQPYDLHPKSLSAGGQKAAYTVHLRKAHDGRLFFQAIKQRYFAYCIERPRTRRMKTVVFWKLVDEWTEKNPLNRPTEALHYACALEDSLHFRDGKIKVVKEKTEIFNQK